MAIIAWGSHFLTGLDEIDRQHQGLVALANVLSDVAAQRPEHIDDAFQQLTAYARDHFALEERLMAESGLPPELTAGHCQAHAAFVADLTTLWQARGADPQAVTRRLLDFLTVWIYKHILITDREMAREIHARCKTKPPENHFFQDSVAAGSGG